MVWIPLLCFVNYLPHLWYWGVRRSYSWRNIFFEGLFTLIASGLGVLILPPYPDKAKCLSPRDRYMALERTNQEHKESFEGRTKTHHVRRSSGRYSSSGWVTITSVVNYSLSSERSLPSYAKRWLQLQNPTVKYGAVSLAAASAFPRGPLFLVGSQQCGRTQHPSCQYCVDHFDR
jgi:hypothetical protein